ncbi:MAG: addiction module protein [Planctomycetes bacterium]|nr:addiction module protein [Planctomycetota bacterium]
MAQTIDLDTVENLTVKKRLKLISAIWKTIDAEELPFTPQQWSVIQRRLRAYRKNPASAFTYKQYQKKMRDL